MKIHTIETGKVKVTSKWRSGQGSGAMRLLNTWFDNEFTDWLPIYTWVLEHPEGLIVIDTGILADANDPVYFPPFMPLIRRAAKFDIRPELEIGPQMQGLGLAPEDVRWVLLTHLHQDHDGGLHYFPNAEFIVSRDEWAVAAGFKGRMGGYLNQRWPTWFQPKLIDFEGSGLGAFAGHHTLTQAGDLHLVPTPGHSAGHFSVILEAEHQSIFFAGDTSYSQDLLLANKVDGVGTNLAAQFDTYQRILAYAAQNPTVYLPSHDPESMARLEARQIIPDSSHKAEEKELQIA